MNAPPVTPGRHLLHRRWVYRTLREVWVEDGRVVEKHFRQYSGRRDFRHLWKREHLALRRLEGLPVPRSLGWKRMRTPEGLDYVLRKTFLPGTPLVQATPRDAADMGQLLAAIHGRRVVNNDPSTANFIRQPDGQLACIDFGRSRTFWWASSFFYLYVGKELVRLYRTGLHEDPDLWQTFLASYHAHSDLLQHHALIITYSQRFWFWYEERRHPREAPKPAAASAERNPA